MLLPTTFVSVGMVIFSLLYLLLRTALKQQSQKMSSPFLLLLPLSLFFSISTATISPKIGINYGQLGNNLPSPSHSIKLIKSLKAYRVKIYDTNPQILKSLSKTNLQVSVMLPNQLINNISTSQSLSDQWVRTNLLPFFPQTKIRYLLVGNEILSSPDQSTWFNLVPAMRRIKTSLKTFKLHKIKVGTPLAMDCLQSSFPPSNGTFRSDIADSVMRPMLQFLNHTKSFFFLDVYPYFPWSSSPKEINLDYALFNGGNVTYTDPVTGLLYTNLFDQMLDSVFFAMEKLGFKDVQLFIAETGWPSACDVDQIGANIYNAATYNRNLIKRMLAKPAFGTPARPYFPIPVFIFSLYNENQKPGAGTERNWGLLYPNGSRVYEVDLTGTRSVSDYKPLPKPENNEPYKGKIWCVVARGTKDVMGGANVTALGGALTYACSEGNATCDALQPGKECYRKGDLVWQTSYAFASYWAQFRKSGGTCYFDGLATQTAMDPSRGSCKFPSVTL